MTYGAWRRALGPFVVYENVYVGHEKGVCLGSATAHRRAAPACMKLALAIVAPTGQQQPPSDGPKIGMSSSNGCGVSEMQTRFTTALRDDLLALLTCRGLLTRGPFANFDAMMFPDCDPSNLLLEPVIEADRNWTVGQTACRRLDG